LGGAAEYGGMNDGIGSAENPLIPVAALYPHSSLIARHYVCAAQGHQSVVALGSKDRRSPFDPS
jgi:hypothetical protein